MQTEITISLCTPYASTLLVGSIVFKIFLFFFCNSTLPFTLPPLHGQPHCYSPSPLPKRLSKDKFADFFSLGLIFSLQIGNYGNCNYYWALFRSDSSVDDVNIFVRWQNTIYIINSTPPPCTLLNSEHYYDFPPTTSWHMHAFPLLPNDCDLGGLYGKCCEIWDGGSPIPTKQREGQIVGRKQR